MKTAIPFLDIDTKPAAGITGLRSRDGNNGRHLGKLPDMFPEVLADVANPKNVTLENVGATESLRKCAAPDEERIPDDPDKAEISEEQKLHPEFSADIKLYLQNFVAINQRQKGTEETVTPLVPATMIHVSGTAESEIEIRSNKKANDDGDQIVTDEMPHFETPKGPELKATGPRPLIVKGGTDLPLSSIDPVPPIEFTELEQLPESKEIHHQKSVGVEIRVIKVETSFAPPTSPTITVQLSNIIIEKLQTPVDGPPVIASNPRQDPRPDVVRNLQIQLHPDDLGKIKVAMHLRGDELRVQIEVTTRKVEALLRSDQQALKDILGQAGYDIKDASISIALSSADLPTLQRNYAANDPSHQSLVGHGGRQHSGAGEESQNQFQRARGPHASASEFESDQDLKSSASASGRGRGVFV
jgi:hypothetical protein